MAAGTISAGWFATGPPTVSHGRAKTSTRPSTLRGGVVAASSSRAAEPSSDPQPRHAASPAPPQPASWPLFLRALAAHAAHLAARVLTQPLQPAADRLRARAATSPAVQRACAALQVDDARSLHDLCNSLVLAESVYRVVDRPEADALRMLSALKATFPPGVVTLSAAQFAQPHVRHRFVVAEGGDALYVGFMGTKMARDILANAAVWQEEVRLDAALLSTDEAESVAGEGQGPATGQPPAAHRGFVTRARGIPIDALYQEARARGKRLVLCGHSLGGAVAQLCTLHLLQRLPREHHDTVHCYGFATPAVGNQALADLVQERGWDARIRNYLVPEDPIPHLLSSRKPPSRTVSTSALPALEAAAAPPASAPLVQASGHAAADVARPSAILQAANNITAVPGMMLRMARSEPNLAALDQAAPGRETGSRSMAEGEGSTLPRVSTSTEGSGEEARPELPRSAVLSGAASASAAAVGPRRRLGAALGAAAAMPAKQAASAALGAVRLVAAVPMRAAQVPKYLPLGRQLYMATDAVRTEQGPLPPPVPPVLALLPAAVAPAAGASAPAAAAAPPAASPGWWPWGWRQGGAGTPPGSSLDDDDDNVDVAAATAAAGGLVPSSLPRRTLWPMHRMVTYRCRLLGICQEALAGHVWPSLLPPLPHLPNVPHPDDVTPTQLLGPGVFPLRAEASLAPLPALVPPAGGVVGTAAAPPAAAEGGSANGATPLPQQQQQQWAALPPRRRWLAPWRLFLRRGAPSLDGAPVEVLVRVEGRGLCNVTAAWISGACLDANGKATPAPAVIVTRPEAPSPAATLRKRPSPLAAPLAAFASWVALAAGWVALLRKLQPAGRADFLVAKVRLPSAAVREAQRAATDPLCVAVGEGPRLMVHLQSHFSTQSLPLDIRIGCAVPAAEQALGGRLRGGFDSSRAFLWQRAWGRGVAPPPK